MSPLPDSSPATIFVTSTPVPTHIIEAISELSGAACKVVLAVCYFTLGWRRAEDLISLRQLAKATGLSLSNVQRGLNEAVDKGLISRRPVNPESHCKGYYYGVCAPNSANAAVPAIGTTLYKGINILCAPPAKGYGPLFPAPDDPAVAV